MKEKKIAKPLAYILLVILGGVLFFTLYWFNGVFNTTVHLNIKGIEKREDNYYFIFSPTANNTSHIHAFYIVFYDLATGKTVEKTTVSYYPSSFNKPQPREVILHTESITNKRIKAVINACYIQPNDAGTRCYPVTFFENQKTEYQKTIIVKD